MKHNTFLFVLFMGLTCQLPAGANQESLSFKGAQGYSQYIQFIMENNKKLISIERSLEAVKAKMQAGDIELNPFLTATASKSDDRRYQPFGSVALDRTEVTDLSVGLQKQWSSGTKTQLGVGVLDQAFTYIGPGLSQTASYSTGALTLGLSQSLWKNQFGHSIDLRRSKDALVYKAEKAQLELSREQLLVTADQLYWDMSYRQEEIQQRQESLARANKISNWINARVSNGIGDKSDTYGGKALVALRELELINAQDESKALSTSLQDMLGLPLTTDSVSFEKVDLYGNINGLPSSQKLTEEAQNLIRYDAYLAKIEAELKKTGLSAVEDQLNPDLTFESLYKTNAISSSQAESFSKISDTSRPTINVALKLSWMLDAEPKRAAKKQADHEWASAQLKTEKLVAESQTQFLEIKRRYQELEKKIQLAKKAAELQNLKAESERDKLSKGRAVTSNVLQAEQEASDAMLVYTKMNTEKHKILSQLRLYIKNEEL